MRTRVRRALKWTGVAATSAPFVAAGAITLVDEHRKRRTPTTGDFPHLPPMTTAVGENAITLYTYGMDLYSDMLTDIAQARHTIYFETFIIKDDDMGQRFRAAFEAAAARGVDVFIMTDTFGTLNQNPRVRRMPRMEHLHAMAFPLVRTGIFTGRSRDKGRDHRKILTIDQSVAYVGGFNIGLEHATKWRDTHIRISGPVSAELRDTFADMWNSYRKKEHPVIRARERMPWDPSLRAVLNSPASNTFPIQALYLDALNRASERAWITMAYFIPDAAMMDALVDAARRGVDVRILIPEYSNHVYTDWVGRPHYQRLLGSGVRIFLYRDAMIHAKTMTMDSRWSTVGTANIDRISLRGNFEINMSILDTGFSHLMERVFEHDLTNAYELTRQAWERRSRLAQVTEAVMRPLAPLL